MPKEKKNIVITGRMVLHGIAVLAIITMVVFTIVELVRGTPFLEIFTENWPIWVGAVMPVLVIFFLFSSDKKPEDGKE
ncbi:MAG: hypothetical protein FWC78_07810 [Defluviitaleaceae bacterium]|nr:hypothetical protein [Defluviitaleaceae bacterium]